MNYDGYIYGVSLHPVAWGAILAVLIIVIAITGVIWLSVFYERLHRLHRGKKPGEVDALGWSGSTCCPKRDRGIEDTAYFDVDSDDSTIEVNYCPNCGQKIDWSEDDDV